MDARLCHKQLPRRHDACTRDQHELVGFLCLRALGLCLTQWLGLTGVDRIIWTFLAWLELGDLRFCSLVLLLLGPWAFVNSRLAFLRRDSGRVHFLSLGPLVRSYSCRAKYCNPFNYTTKGTRSSESKLGKRLPPELLTLVRRLYRSALRALSVFAACAGKKAPVCGGCRRVAATTFTGIGAFFPARARDIRVKVTRVGYVDSCWSQLHTMDAVHTAITPCQCLPFFISEPVDACRLDSERVQLLACLPHHSQLLDPPGQAPDNTQHTFRTRSQFRISPTPTYQGRQTGLGPLYPGRCFF